MKLLSLLCLVSCSSTYIASLDTWKPRMIDGANPTGVITFKENEGADLISKNIKRSGGILMKGSEKYQIPSYSVIAVPNFEELVKSEITEQGKTNLDANEKIQLQIADKLKLLDIKKQTCFDIVIYSRGGMANAELSSWVFKVKSNEQIFDGKYFVSTGPLTLPTAVDTKVSQFGANSLWMNSNRICVNKKITRNDKFSVIAILQGSKEQLSNLSSDRIELEWN